MMLKRYQYWGPEGIVWTSWFPANHTEEQYQYKNKLLNQYKDESKIN